MASNDEDRVVEGKVVALAEQLGWFLGTVQNKAEGWLDREALNTHVTRIRDGASELLKHISASRAATLKTGAKPAAKPKAATAAQKASRAPVAAPGKKHRKPPPQERVDRRMGEPVGKKMGQKNLKNARRGRG